MSNEAERSSWEIVHKLVEVDQDPRVSTNSGKMLVLYPEEEGRTTKPAEKLDAIQKALGVDQNQKPPYFGILSIPNPEVEKGEDLLTIKLEPPRKFSRRWEEGGRRYESLDKYINDSPSKAPSQGRPAKELFDALIRTSKEICKRAHGRQYLLRYFEWDAFLLCTDPDSAPPKLRIIYTGHRYAIETPKRIGSDPYAGCYKPTNNLKFKPEGGSDPADWGFTKSDHDIQAARKSIQAAIEKQFKQSALTEDEKREIEERLKNEFPEDGPAKVDPAPTSAPGDGLEPAAAKTANRPGNRQATSSEPKPPAQAHPKAQLAGRRNARRYAIFLGIGIAAGCIAFIPWTIPDKPEQNIQWPNDTFSMEYNGTTTKTIPAVPVVLKGRNGKSRTNTLMAELTFNSKDAGNAKSVTWRLLHPTPDGPSGGARKSISGTSPGTIRPKRLEPKLQALRKKYDGNPYFPAEISNLEGTINSDDVTVSGELTFVADDPASGTNKTVSLVQKPNIKGNDSGNYTISWPTQATATIEPRPLTFRSNSELDKHLRTLTRVGATSNLLWPQWTNALAAVFSNDCTNIQMRLVCTASDNSNRTFQVSLTGSRSENYSLPPNAFTVTGMTDPPRASSSNDQGKGKTNVTAGGPRQPPVISGGGSHGGGPAASNGVRADNVVSNPDDRKEIDTKSIGSAGHPPGRGSSGNTGTSSNSNDEYQNCIAEIDDALQTLEEIRPSDGSTVAQFRKTENFKSGVNKIAEIVKKNASFWKAADTDTKDVLNKLVDWRYLGDPTSTKQYRSKEEKAKNALNWLKQHIESQRPKK